MSTDAQITANRLNSLKSTGPTSPEGKARSSMNALKSGIDAELNIIPGEDPAELEALTTQFLDLFQPADPNQLSLVDALISAEWTQRRLRRIEAELWRSHVEHLHDGIEPDSRRSSPHQQIIDPFTRIERRIDATNRLYLRTLKALQDLQATPAPSLPNQPLTPHIGFVPEIAPTQAELPLQIHTAHAKSQILNPKSHPLPSLIRNAPLRTTGLTCN